MGQHTILFDEKYVGELVSEDYRRADIFKSFVIDFCCGGKKSVSQVCEDKGVDKNELVKALMDLQFQVTGPKQDYRDWSPDFMCDYITHTHHKYVTNAIPVIRAYIEKVARVHGGDNPSLVEIVHLFNELANELLDHMRKEEVILFPYIKNMAAAKHSGLRLPSPAFVTIKNPIAAMEADHEGAGNAMAKIHELTRNFTPPEHACATYRVSFASLKAFEDDLHLHVHLENNILFPAAIAMERTLINPIGK